MQFLLYITMRLYYTIIGTTDNRVINSTTNIIIQNQIKNTLTCSYLCIHTHNPLLLLYFLCYFSKANKAMTIIYQRFYFITPLNQTDKYTSYYFLHKFIKLLIFLFKHHYTIIYKTSDLIRYRYCFIHYANHLVAIVK
jgi:hypothetical protein